MSAEVTGRVDRIEDRQAKNGGEYNAITLKGRKKPFFDWEGQCKAAEITAGDTVKIEFDDGDFPRVMDIVKVGGGEPIETNESKEQENKDDRATRMCALECAARVLQGTDQPVTEVTALAERLLEWILG